MDNLISEHFGMEMPTWLQKVSHIRAESSPCNQILEPHAPVDAVIFLPGFQLLASALNNKTVRIWDFTTGECKWTLEDYYSTVCNVVLSPNDQQLASASDNKTAQRLLWLPPDRRPVCSAVVGNLVVMGHGSGGITFIEFKPEAQLF